MREFDRIIGYEGIKRELEQTADILRNLDVYKAAGAKTPSGMLIHGDPGVGKSLMAECLIEASGLPTFTVRKDKVNGAFVDFVKETFEKAARCAPSIVYLDDMDKFANADSRHRNADEYVTVQSCIDSVKGSDVFVLATTNELYCLPDSLHRAGRFDRKINVCSPDGDEASAIIKHYLSDKQLGDDIDWDDVVMLMCGCTCAELEVTLNEALLVAVSKREGSISKQSFMEAFFKTRMRSLLGNVCVEAKAGESERRRIALHEAGHAAVFEILAMGSVSLATAFKMIESKGGACHFVKPVNCTQRSWEEIYILGGLGGRAAMDLVYGAADEGASSDFQLINGKIANRIIDGLEFGMPFWKSARYQPSESSKWRLETLTEAETSRLYQKVKEMLAANREFLDRLTDAIFENDYLLASDIQAIRESCAIVPMTATCSIG